MYNLKEPLKKVTYSSVFSKFLLDLTFLQISRNTNILKRPEGTGEWTVAGGFFKRLYTWKKEWQRWFIFIGKIAFSQEAKTGYVYAGWLKLPWENPVLLAWRTKRQSWKKSATGKWGSHPTKKGAEKQCSKCYALTLPPKRMKRNEQSLRPVGQYSKVPGRKKECRENIWWPKLF